MAKADRGGSAMSEPAPILCVTVGAPVYAQDGDKIGKVKDVRQGPFQVETGLFQPNFWLAGEVVESAFPDEAVTLTAPKSEIDKYKSTNPKPLDLRALLQLWAGRPAESGALVLAYDRTSIESQPLALRTLARTDSLVRARWR